MHSNGNEWILGRTKKTQWAPVKLWQKVKYTLGCSDQQRPKSVRSTNIIQDHLDISFPKLRRLARPSGNFPNHKKLTRSTRNFLNSTESFRPCGDFLNSPETFRCNFKVTSKNFPEVHKLSDWHCQPGFRVSGNQFRLSHRVGLGLGPRAHLDPRCARCTNLETHVAQILPMPQFGQSF